jgi:hypothetical protein
MNKEALYLSEIESLCYAYSGFSYWDVYYMPVPIRKYFIKQYNKRIDQAQKDADSEQKNFSRPLSDMEKAKHFNRQGNPKPTRTPFKVSTNK